MTSLREFSNFSLNLDEVVNSGDERSRLEGFGKKMERIVFSFFLFPRYDPRLVPISSLSRPADNYVPRGETRWIGEIDRRDRCRLEAAVSAEGIQRKGTNPCAVKHE